MTTKDSRQGCMKNRDTRASKIFNNYLSWGFSAISEDIGPIATVRAINVEILMQNDLLQATNCNYKGLSPI
jgi:hypothetical protein